MKNNFTLFIFVFLFLLNSALHSQTESSTTIIKNETDTLFDYTSWPNKGRIGIMPVQLLPWLSSNNMLNYGIGADVEFALPKWATFRVVASINLFEGERKVWKEKVWDNVDNVNNGYWMEGGVDINVYDFKSKSSSFEIDSNGRYIYTDAIERKNINGKISDETISITQPLYGKYYSFASFVYRPAVRVGFIQYQNTFADKSVEYVTNISTSMFYGGLSFSKIGLGRAFYLSGYADLLYKTALKTPIESVAYETRSVDGLIGYRAGLRASSDWLGGLIEFGMSPGLDVLESYLKLGLVINYHLLPPRKNKFKKGLESDIENQKD